MIKSGISLAEAIEIIGAQSTSPKFKAILIQVGRGINNGQSLSDCLKKYPKVFDALYINLIAIGEESGSLEENLGFLSDQLAKDYALQKKIQAALFYPAIIFSATGMIGSFIAFFILPTLVDFFNAFEVELPLATRVLLFFALLIKNYGIFLIIGAIGAAFGLASLFRIPAIKYQAHKWVLRTPVFGAMLLGNEMARFSRNLGTLLKSGVTLPSALEASGRSLSNEVVKKGVLFALGEIEKGKQLSEALEKYHEKVFPFIVTKMIGVGEKTGKLEETLIYIGNFYEDEIDTITKNLTTILEPLLLIFIGIVVGFMALAIISPIYQLTGSIKN